MGTQVFILTHEQDATDNLFSMVDRFHKYNHPENRLKAGASNAKEPSHFPAATAAIVVGTAGPARSAGRKPCNFSTAPRSRSTANSSPITSRALFRPCPTCRAPKQSSKAPRTALAKRVPRTLVQQAEAGIGDYIPIFVPLVLVRRIRTRPSSRFRVNRRRGRHRRDVRTDAAQDGVAAGQGRRT